MRILALQTGVIWQTHPRCEPQGVTVKALDGRTFNNRYWVFYASLSNVEYTITVTDTETGAVRTYFNPSGRFASVGDTDAF